MIAANNKKAPSRGYTDTHYAERPLMQILISRQTSPEFTNVNRFIINAVTDPQAQAKSEK